MKSAAEHAELLRKVETVNTLTSVNKKLQDDKDRLVKEAADLNAKVARLEADILPIEGEINFQCLGAGLLSDSVSRLSLLSIFPRIIQSSITFSLTLFSPAICPIQRRGVTCKRQLT